MGFSQIYDGKDAFADCLYRFHLQSIQSVEFQFLINGRPSLIFFSKKGHSSRRSFVPLFVPNVWRRFFKAYKDYDSNHEGRGIAVSGRLRYSHIHYLQTIAYYSWMRRSGQSQSFTIRYNNMKNYQGKWWIFTSQPLLSEKGSTWTPNIVLVLLYRFTWSLPKTLNI